MCSALGCATGQQALGTVPAGGADADLAGLPPAAARQVRDLMAGTLTIAFRAHQLVGGFDAELADLFSQVETLNTSRVKVLQGRTGAK